MAVRASGRWLDRAAHHRRRRIRSTCRTSAGCLVALGLRDGRQRWEIGGFSDGFNWAPAVAGGVVYVAASRTRVLRVASVSRWRASRPCGRGAAAATLRCWRLGAGVPLLPAVIARRLVRRDDRRAAAGRRPRRTRVPLAAHAGAAVADPGRLRSSVDPAFPRARRPASRATAPRSPRSCRWRSKAANGWRARSPATGSLELRSAALGLVGQRLYRGRERSPGRRGTSG